MPAGAAPQIRGECYVNNTCALHVWTPPTDGVGWLLERWGLELFGWAQIEGGCQQFGTFFL